MLISLLIALSLIFTASKIKQASYFAPAKQMPAPETCSVRIAKTGGDHYKNAFKKMSVISLR